MSTTIGVRVNIEQKEMIRSLIERRGFEGSGQLVRTLIEEEYARLYNVPTLTSTDDTRKGVVCGGMLD